MKQLYIFDFDGVLIDTILDSIKAFNVVLREFNIPEYSEDLTTFKMDEFWAYLDEQVEKNEFEFYSRFVEVYEQSELKNTKAFDNMEYVLKTLQDEGKTLAICSNREVEHIKLLLDKYLGDIDFKEISGYEYDKPNKPDPYRLNKVIENLKIDKSDVVYIGDRIVDVQTAINAGVDMVLVTYGQGDSEAYSHPYPIMLIDNPIELLDLE